MSALDGLDTDLHACSSDPWNEAYHPVLHAVAPYV
jgi:hypothetical protein